MQWRDSGQDLPRTDAASVLIAKNEKTGQTNVQFNSLSIGGSNDSLSDAEDQANQAKNQEGPRGGSQAIEEADEAKRKDGQCGCDEKWGPLAVFQREPGNPKGIKL
jgi:hypothetical protein